MKMHKRSLVVLSGGQDSTTCLFLAARDSEEVLAVTFAYGQRHSIEVNAALSVYRIASILAADQAAFLTHEVVELGPILRGTSPLVSAAPVEEYADAGSLPGGIEKTFVPMRNALFTVLAYNRAVVDGCDAVYLGVSQEDYGGYPDCRASFIGAMAHACEEAIGESAFAPRLVTPLLYLTKAQTVTLSSSLPGCRSALAYSHTCYQGVYPPCGRCHACLLRAKGFAEAGEDDPLIVRAELDK